MDFVALGAKLDELFEAGFGDGALDGRSFLVLNGDDDTAVAADGNSSSSSGGGGNGG